jgi:hypothetical protein
VVQVALEQQQIFLEVHKHSLEAAEVEHLIMAHLLEEQEVPVAEVLEHQIQEDQQTQDLQEQDLEVAEDAIYQALIQVITELQVDLEEL